VCVCVCVCVCMCVCMCVHVCVYVCVHMCVHVCVCASSETKQAYKFLEHTNCQNSPHQTLQGKQSSPLSKCYLQIRVKFPNSAGVGTH